ncbi:anthranilate synthase component I family protein [Sinomicrobium weinanense]|uniref:Chorismate-binding protein n=1 Tax=Sinomicrobium weinanense TaxID=2842200 RepID=A0A926JW12_9FLAO|nr:anthranilate synthase component I family protein [Sinomicrobium weinanense]MBC9798515.1 chorismate-binding protein [Sinomicrobium weinanense]MBU3122977.1 anthranilate synthase component I family protein [Sinomicrobium weinanense]
MRRTEVVFPLEDGGGFKEKLLLWAQQYTEVIWLDSNDYQHLYPSFDAVLAVDALTAIKTDHHHAFDDLKEYQATTADWIFGYLSYDLKNDVEKLTSSNTDHLHFPELYFFQPKKMIFIKGNTAKFHYLPMVDDEVEEDFNAVRDMEEKDTPELRPIPGEGIKARIPREAYLQKVEQMLVHIRRGDIYEANFCQEFYTEEAGISPLKAFFGLNAISRPPFAAYLKLEDKYLISASPERYLKRTGNKVVSQPIKGTARRAEDPEEDQQLKHDLENTPKERSENIMIVDLVRNDLSVTAKKGSVRVEELCEVYTFEQVHQLISTVTSEVEDDISSVDIIRSTFPMGSMTGAPKISAMKIIEKLEETKRGLYSGAVGYFTPSGDFDFNVVIRSILYNAADKYVSFTVGGAITGESVPEKEYEECLIKARAMRRVLEE